MGPQQGGVLRHKNFDGDAERKGKRCLPIAYLLDCRRCRIFKKAYDCWRAAPGDDENYFYAITL